MLILPFSGGSYHSLTSAPTELSATATMTVVAGNQTMGQMVQVRTVCNLLYILSYNSVESKSQSYMQAEVWTRFTFAVITLTFHFSSLSTILN